VTGRHLLLGVLGALFAPTWLAAQAAGRDSSCEAAIQTARVDSVDVKARAYLLRGDEGALTPRARALVLESILAHFSAPRPLRLPVFSAGPVRLRMLRTESLGDSLTIREPIVYGEYRFTLRQRGALANVAATIPSMVPGFDEAILAAIRASVADSMLVPVVRATDEDSITFDLRITTGPEDTRVRVPPVTVFTAAFPRVRLVDAKPAGTIPLPTYPDAERDEGQDGEVVLRVVIDASGAPLIPTLEILRATSPAFALSAARTLARYHFAPAHVGACGVPQVVEVPFWFSLRP
jgi:TonB family protein